MNKYPLWKYLLISLVLGTAFLFTLPNFYGELPAVQIGKIGQKDILSIQSNVLESLKQAQIPYQTEKTDAQTMKVIFADTDLQLKAKDVIAKTVNPDNANEQFSVALNLVPASPAWLQAFTRPMYLGLDLRGGVHFMLQVDMKTAVSKKLDEWVSVSRKALREKRIQHDGVRKIQDNITVFLDPLQSDFAQKQKDIIETLAKQDLIATSIPTGVQIYLNEVQLTKIKSDAVEQNIKTLHNRINELGVAEPVIQRQGLDRIVVQLPGIQDTAKAKEILGRTATLEMRLYDENSSTKFEMQNSPEQIPVKNEVIITGENLEDAQASLDSNNGGWVVSLKVNNQGANSIREVSGANIGKRMAIVLFEKNIGKVLTAPTIQSELGDRFQITGMDSPQAATDLALLLRAGALVAPMEIIEERTIGPSMGKDNISKGFNSTLYGFIAIAIFMVIYYQLFGVFSMVALAANLLCLIAILSLLQATLTLPGIAAIALTLGMAIDANVLINERIREELRSGESPHKALLSGYDKAFDTILDSNVTTFIAGLALLIFGTGAVRGFAVVHCLGILTSIFSAILVSRMSAHLWYGHRKGKLNGLAIGQIWKGEK
jgi:preprotein translocase subunit SecD